MYFVPMFDETSGYYDSGSAVSIATWNIISVHELTRLQWWSSWGGIVEGLFSWESAWPVVGDGSSSSCGSMSPDMPVIDGASSHSKSYMIGK